MTCFLWPWWLAGTMLPLGVRPLLPHPASLGPRLTVVMAPGTHGPVAVLLPTIYYASPAGAAFGWSGWGWLLALYAAGVGAGLARLAGCYG